MKKTAKCFVKMKREELKKKAPKGVNPEKHERCVHDLKAKGKNIGSAHAICTSAMKKSDNITIPRKEMIKEHKRLVAVLRSPSHKDDKQEAKEQAKELKEYMKKTAPKGVNKEKYDRCVKEVKRKRSANNAYAVCSASLQKAHKDKIPGGKADKKNPKDFDQKQLQMGIKVEMEHTNDKTLAQEIAMDHLTEDAKYYTKLKQVHVEKSKVSSVDSRSEHLANKIMSHNRKKLHKFVNKYKIKKSLDFQNAKVSVDSIDQQLAEQTAAPKLIEYIKRSLSYANDEICKIPFVNGTLTLSKKDEGLYNGFFQDSKGQVIEQFDNQTPELVAKNMIVKNIYYSQVDAAVNLEHLYTAVNIEHPDEAEDEELIDDKVNEALTEHNALYHRGQNPGEPINSKGYIRIKSGDFELEIKKSIKGFIKDYKFKKSFENEFVTEDLIIKSVKTWRKRASTTLNLISDQAAAKEIFNNWDQHQEAFLQIIHGHQMLEEDDEA